MYPHAERFHINTLIDVAEDISISRPANKVPRGIPVPDDEEQIVDSWLESLIGYLTALEYPGELTTWPADIQITGKDGIK